ncbi:MAG: hypothetical protein GWQ08_19880 [Verrucomicrobiaceae bacterium]|nr:hypothetical protein [Verrucomicrobiaceae bacterium]
MRSLLLLFGCLVLSVTSAVSELRVSNIFGDHMVIQRDQPIRVWGWAEPGASVRVIFASRDLTVKADRDGAWSVELEGLSASSQPHHLAVTSAKESVNYDGILLGDVWV